MRHKATLTNKPGCLVPDRTRIEDHRVDERAGSDRHQRDTDRVASWVSVATVTPSEPGGAVARGGDDPVVSNLIAIARERFDNSER